jgi:hypothetical protein
MRVVDPELADVIQRWPVLPKTVRAAVLALVGTIEPATSVSQAKRRKQS